MGGQITARAARRRTEAAGVRVRVGSHRHPGANYRACSGFFPYVHGAIVTLGLQRGHSMGQRYLPDGALLRCMKIAAMVAMEFDSVFYELSALGYKKRNNRCHADAVGIARCLSLRGFKPEFPPRSLSLPRCLLVPSLRFAFGPSFGPLVAKNVRLLPGSSRLTLTHVTSK